MLNLSIFNVFIIFHRVIGIPFVPKQLYMFRSNLIFLFKYHFKAFISRMSIDFLALLDFTTQHKIKSFIIFQSKCYKNPQYIHTKFALVWYMDMKSPFHDSAELVRARLCAVIKIAINYKYIFVKIIFFTETICN